MSKTVTKAEIISKIHETSDVSKKVIEEIVQEFVETIRDELIAGNDIRIQELGTFKVSVRKAHMGRNPQTGEAIEIKETLVPKLKVSSGLTRLVNE